MFKKFTFFAVLAIAAVVVLKPGDVLAHSANITTDRIFPGSEVTVEGTANLDHKGKLGAIAWDTKRFNNHEAPNCSPVENASGQGEHNWSFNFNAPENYGWNKLYWRVTTDNCEAASSVQEKVWFKVIKPVHLTLDKKWEVKSDVDGVFNIEDVTTTFDVNVYRNKELVDSYSNVAVGEKVQVKKHDWVKVTENVTGLNELCEYSSEGHWKFISKRGGWYQSNTVTNTVTCDEEPEVPVDTPEEEPKEEGEVLGDEDKKQVEAPVGAVSAGGGSNGAGAAGLAGLMASLATLGLGVLFRKELALEN